MLIKQKNLVCMRGVCVLVFFIGDRNLLVLHISKLKFFGRDIGMIYDDLFL